MTDTLNNLLRSFFALETIWCDFTFSVVVDATAVVVTGVGVVRGSSGMSRHDRYAQQRVNPSSRP